eukprot:m.243245 g.243245  ORF g.243245 m.243245 type:complete len:560 (+) comp40237_c0_seq43:393-2072(+)
MLESGSLKIENVGESDVGLYECTAESSLGSSYEQVILRMDNMYANTGGKKGKIAWDNFEAYVKEFHADEDNGFLEEFSKLDGPEKHPFVAARREANKDKNRYANIVPYDKSRVVLETLPGISGSDYINASFLDAYGCPNGYIAAQGPNEKAENDFWRMVWQMKVPTIVMVTNVEERGKTKCVQYWPDLDEKRYDQLRVSLRGEQSLLECTVRILDVYKRNSDGTVLSHTVTQFHFTSWPDHGVPAHATSLLTFVKRARSHHERVKDGGPMLIHCSAGVGRTGTFIVIDYSLQRLKAENIIDIFNLINYLRDNRPNMVQTERQYMFCHDAIFLWRYRRFGPQLKVILQWAEKVDPVDKKCGIQKQLQLLQTLSPKKEAFSFRRGSDAACDSKNRYAKCLPPDTTRVRLVPKGGQPENYTYINAQFVSGYSCRDLYIATQGPFETTVFDFWRMIWEQKCGAIVMLTKLQQGRREMSARYWPSKGKATYDKVSVELDSETTFSDYIVRDLKVTRGKKRSRLVKQYHYMAWMESDVPKNSSTLLDMIMKMERAQPTSGLQQWS